MRQKYCFVTYEPLSEKTTRKLSHSVFVYFPDLASISALHQLFFPHLPSRVILTPTLLYKPVQVNRHKINYHTYLQPCDFVLLFTDFGPASALPGSPFSCCHFENIHDTVHVQDEVHDVMQCIILPASARERKPFLKISQDLRELFCNFA